MKGSPAPMLAAVVISTFAVPLNSSMVSLALGPMADSFAVPLAQVAWVVSIYLVGMAVFQILAGRLTDAFGSRAVFFGGSALFWLGSLLCVRAPAFWALLAGRLVQALGGAVLVPAGAVVLKEATPPDRLGRVLGLVGATAGLGAGFGPPVGGLLLRHFDWRAQFLATLAVMLLPLALQILDGWPGIVRRCGGAQQPLLDLRLFTSRVFAAAVASIFLNNFMLYSVLLCVPLYLRSRWQLPADRAGLVLFACSAAMTAAVAAGGWLSDRTGRRLPVLAGALVAAAGGGIAAAAGSPGLLAAGIAVAGLGLGIGAAAMQAAALDAGDPYGAGVAAGTFSTVRYLGSIAATQVLVLGAVGGLPNFALQAGLFIACGLAGAAAALGLPPAARAPSFVKQSL